MRSEGDLPRAVLRVHGVFDLEGRDCYMFAGRFADGAVSVRPAEQRAHVFVGDQLLAVVDQWAIEHLNFLPGADTSVRSFGLFGLAQEHFEKLRASETSGSIEIRFF